LSEVGDERQRDHTAAPLSRQRGPAPGVSRTIS